MSGRATNRGTPTINEALDAVSLDDIRTIAAAVWEESHHHGATASCECPAIEAIAQLIHLGYTIERRVS